MSMMETNHRLTLVILIALIITFTTFTRTVLAVEISLEEAISLGIENNKEIDDERKNIRQIERDLAKEIASNDWQIGLGVGYDYNFNKEDDSKSLNISIGRNFLSGLEIVSSGQRGTNISIDEDLEPSLFLSVSQNLYPQVPTELAQNYYRTEKNLLKAERNLKEVKVDSILSWLDSYLNISRMSEKQAVFKESLTKAEDNLTKVLVRQEIGDAGKNEVLTAELSLENAKYSLKEAENQLEDSRYTLANELGLSLADDLIISDNSQYIARLQEEAQKYAEKYLKEDTADLVTIVAENNIDLQANLLEREVLEQELSWLEEEDKINLDLNGSYDTSDDDLEVGLSLSYQLYDSGQHELALEDKKAALADNLSGYEDLYKQLQQEFKQLLATLELSQMALEKGRLSLARSQFELEVAEKQLELGLIDYLEYQEYWIAAAEAEIEIDLLEDQLFLNRLDFIRFLDLDLVAGIIGGL